jgi:hypothetical protein
LVQWRGEVEELPKDHDPADRTQAIAQAFRTDSLPVGLFYKEIRPTLDSHTRVTNHPLKAGAYDVDVRELLESYR